MKTLSHPLALAVLSSVVLATGGMAWSAGADNDVQEQRIENIEKQHEESQKTQKELLQQLVEQNKNLAVLTERLSNIQEQLRAREQ